MQLEKRNETVWSIKRKDHPGRFILRAAEEGGKVIQVAIGLENGENSIVFQMNGSEFQNFYGIISSFKELVEGPSAEAAIQQVLDNMPPQSEEPSVPEPPPLLGLDGASVASTKNGSTSAHKTNSPPSMTDAEIDASLASLETLDQGKITPIKQKTSAANAGISTSPIASVSKPAPMKRPEPVAVPKAVKVETPVKVEEKSDTGKKLKETDWDPW